MVKAWLAETRSLKNSGISRNILINQALASGIRRIIHREASAAPGSANQFQVAINGSACSVESGGDATNGSATGTEEVLKVEAAGSSTVFPIASAIAERFEDETDAKVQVASIGSGGGFDRFVTGDLDISNASRPIKESEQTSAEENGVEYVELKVATDGISVVVNPENDWVETLTVEQLRSIWQEGGGTKKWSDLDPEWPDEEIKLFGPDTNSGTFDYFSEVVIDEDAGHIAGDAYMASEDDNQLITGVANEKFGLGYFGFSYYINNKDRLKAVPIDGGNGPVEPTFENIEAGTYTPLARPLFIYVNKKRAAANSAIRDYVKYFVSDEAQELIKSQGFVVLGADALAATREMASEVTGD